MTRLQAMLQKEFIQMRRDPVTLIIMFLLPVFLMLLFGFAIRTDIKHQHTIVFDQSLTKESRSLLASFSASEYFDIDYTAKSFADIKQHLDEGKDKVGIIIPPDLTNNLKHDRPTPIQVIVDASDSNAATAAMSAAESIGTLKSREILLQKYHAAGIKEDTMKLYDTRIMAWYNRDFITAYYMLPGIMGIVLTMTMVMLTSMAIVRERERGTLEQLIVTPLHTWELLLGKLIPYIFIGYVQATIALLVGVAVFNLPIRGSLLALYALTTLFIIASLSLGLMISTIAATQMQAMQMSFLLLMMPSFLLSGFIFPREAMPTFFYYFSAILPMTHYIDILRGIILRGCSFASLTSQAAALAGIFALTFGIAVRKFSRTMN
jgi:ABC-2 type transport system permease protein